MEPNGRRGEGYPENHALKRWPAQRLGTRGHRSDVDLLDETLGKIHCFSEGIPGATVK
jgi:hypothetical protein